MIRTLRAAGSGPRITGILLGVCLGLAAGCVGRGRHELGIAAIGNPESRSFILDGVTTWNDVLETIGEPSRVRPVRDTPGQEIVIYDHEDRLADGSALFLIFATGTLEKRSQRLYLEVTDGTVTRHWFEE